MSFDLCITKQFDDDLKALMIYPEIMSKLSKVFRFLQEDPRKYQSSLQTEGFKRRHAAGGDILKSRVDHSYRVAWRYAGPNRIALLRVGAHDFIDYYVQLTESDIVRIMPAQSDARPAEQRTAKVAQYVPLSKTPARIFEPWKPIHLRLLGVPENQVCAVQRITDIEQVYDLGLPEYAVKNLVDAYMLEDWTTDSVFDGSALLYRANADQLEAYCKGEIKQLLLNLSPEQEELVNMRTTGPTLIKGVAGSGKSTVGVYRAMAQTDMRDLFHGDTLPRVLFITYTETLAQVVRQMFIELYGRERAKQVEVWVLRNWLQAYLANKPDTYPVATQAQMDDAIARGIYKARQLSQNSTLSRLGNEFFRSEIDDVIKGRNLCTWEQYASAKRPGRRVGLGGSARRFVWAIYEEYETRLEQIERWDYLDLALASLRHLPKDNDFKPYDAVILDEAQDLCPVELQAVSILAGTNARNLVLLADPSQSIYYKGIPWKEGGVRIAAARSFNLAHNYRNTRQILDAAWDIATDYLTDDITEPVIQPEKADRYGPVPQVVTCTHDGAQDHFIVETIKHLCGDMKYRPGDIAILARRKDTVMKLQYALVRAGIPARHFRDPYFNVFENEVKTLTINSAKGLEFPVVFLANIDEGELPRAFHAVGDDDDQLHEELDAHLRAERRLLYVGMTRAARHLYLICNKGLASRFINDLSPEKVKLTEISHPEADEKMILDKEEHKLIK